MSSHLHRHYYSHLLSTGKGPYNQFCNHGISLQPAREKLSGLGVTARINYFWPTGHGFFAR